MTDIWHSYPKIYAIGHSAICGIFEDPVLIEEKIDGSQISFGLIDGELRIKSKGKEQYPATDKMFDLAVEQIKSLNLTPDVMYSGEYLNKPKHNTLSYGRVPNKNVILFDIRNGAECYFSYEEKKTEADRIGLEVVPLLYSGKIEDLNQLTDLMTAPSILGGVTIEGFVVKNYHRFTREGKAMMGKYVSEEFKEKNQKDFRLRNPQKSDVVGHLCEIYQSEARWKKAVQRLRDEDLLEQSPKDIGKLISAVQQDLKDEEEEAIKEVMFKHVWPQISRKAIAGFPEWYKKFLLESEFDK